MGDGNIFIFGLDADGVANLKKSGYNPFYYYNNNQELSRVINQIQNGFFSKNQPDLFRPIVDSLLYQGNTYMLFADFDSYVKCQDRVAEAFTDRKKWAKMSILNTAGMGKFSTDRTIAEYAKDIWNVKSVQVKGPGPV